MNYPDDLSANQPYRVTADTNFTIKGWLFTKPISTTTATIFDVQTNIITLDDITSISSGDLNDRYKTNNNVIE